MAASIFRSFIKPTRHDVYPFIDPLTGLKDAAKGKVVLVTGAGSGIGRGIAEAFALAGASEVIVAARRIEKLEETRAAIESTTPSCKVSVRSLDISDTASVNSLFNNLGAAPDVLVSNAAVTLSKADISKSDPALVAQEIDINVKGPYLMARAYVSAINETKREGCLINVSSESSWKFIPHCSTYGATKVALNYLTESLQKEEELKGGQVRCVAMHPGGVVTELGGGDFPADIKSLLIDKPALSGATAVYLSTERARYLMGRYVPATADMEELESFMDEIVKEDLLTTRVMGWRGLLG